MFVEPHEVGGAGAEDAASDVFDGLLVPHRLLGAMFEEACLEDVHGDLDAGLTEWVAGSWLRLLMRTGLGHKDVVDHGVGMPMRRRHTRGRAERAHSTWGWTLAR